MKVMAIQEEYEKNESIKPEDVKILMKWVEEEEHLPQVTELEALIFLSGQSGKQEDAKKKIEVYYSSRTKLPEFFKNRIPQELTLDFVLYMPLPIPSNCDNTIICKIMNSNTTHFKMAEQVKIVGMVTDLYIIQEGSRKDYQYVVDASGVNMGHLMKFNIKVVKNAIFVLQETLPVNVSYIHVINVMPIVEKIFNIAKPFIKNYLLNKIIFHTNGVESLYDYVPQEYLPQNIGGNGPTYEELHSKMKQELLDNTEYFIQEENSKRSDESKRKK